MIGDEVPADADAEVLGSAVRARFTELLTVWDMKNIREIGKKKEEVDALLTPVMQDYMMHLGARPVTAEEVHGAEALCFATEFPRHCMSQIDYRLCAISSKYLIGLVLCSRSAALNPSVSLLLIQEARCLWSAMDFSLMAMSS